MHPILARRERLRLYLAPWLPLSGLVAGLLTLSGTYGWVEAALIAVPMTAVYAFFCLSAWYLCKTLPLTATPAWRLFAAHATAAAITSSLWVLLGMAWVTLLDNVTASGRISGSYPGHVPQLFGVGVLIFLLSVSIHYILVEFQSSREAESNALQLQLSARDAELKALKAQIDPHFLFNSLNSVSALVVKNPGKAREMCIALAEFFRNTLALATKETLSLKEELDLARTFLAIEEVRFGSRLQVRVAVEEKVLDCAVPPLILQPLVENAVKHGIARLLEGGTITIAASMDESRVRILIENPRDPMIAVAKSNGYGLSIVRERLKAWSRLDTALEWEADPERFLVRLWLPAGSPMTGEAEKQDTQTKISHDRG